MIIQVIYNINDCKDHVNLCRLLEKLGDGSLHVLDNLWWIKFNKNTSIYDIYRKLENLEELGLFLVTELDKNNVDGRLAKSHWEWLNK